MTFPERLDASANGEQFTAVLQSLFRALERAIDDEADDE